jgi:hypothetical protein
MTVASVASADRALRAPSPVPRAFTSRTSRPSDGCRARGRGNKTQRTNQRPAPAGLDHSPQAPRIGRFGLGQKTCPQGQLDDRQYSLTGPPARTRPPPTAGASPVRCVTTSLHGSAHATPPGPAGSAAGRPAPNVAAARRASPRERPEPSGTSCRQRALSGLRRRGLSRHADRSRCPDRLRR